MLCENVLGCAYIQYIVCMHRYCIHTLAYMHTHYTCLQGRQELHRHYWFDSTMVGGINVPFLYFYDLFI